jgi:hypothetical protein
LPDLDAQRKALLARLLADEGLGRSASERIPVRSAAGPAPLSFGQRRLWLLDQMALPGPPAYNMPAAYLLDGDLDVAALGEAFAALAQRHDVLRSSIVTIDGEPRQVTGAAAPVAIVTVDLSAESDPIAAFTREAAALAQRPFDLAVAPLMRVAQFRLGPSRHGLAVVLHHIVADGWSLPILLREVMAFYADARRGRPSSLPPLPIQYADYAVWHRALMESAAADVHRDYWRGRFGDGAPPLDLPADFARPSVRSFHGAEVQRHFSAELLAGLRSLSHSRGTSLFSTLLAGVQVLLSRQSGQRDVTVGTPSAGRVRPELADQVGFYVNMLPVRTRVDAGEPFIALRDRVVRHTRAPREHEVYPFDLLVHDLHLDRDLARSPLFDVVLVVDKADDAVLGFEGLAVEPIHLPLHSSKFDLTLHFVEHADRLELTLEYSTDLFAPARIERFAGQLERLLHAVVGDPTCAVARLPLIAAAERSRLVALGATTAATAWQGSVVEQFERQARRRPDAIAATCDEVQVTYRELNASANRLAHRLTARGVGAETLVGIALDRSIDFVVAILGVLKAGGAYVPLDPAYPADRLRYLVADSGLQTVIARASDQPVWLGGEDDAGAVASDWPTFIANDDTTQATHDDVDQCRATFPDHTP